MQWLGISFVCFLLLFFIKPLRRTALLALRTALAFAGILAFNLIGANFGAALGANLINAALIGILGLPGIASVVALNFII